MEKMEKKFSDNEDIGIFDIEMSNLDNIQHKNLTKDVTGFPTMRYVKGNVCEDYEKCDGITTDRSYSSFLDWINKKNGKENVVLLGGGKRKSQSLKKQKDAFGKEDFGTYKNGSSVFKDKNGYYIDEWDNDKQENPVIKKINLR